MNGVPNNLMPSITKVAKGELEKLKIFGKGYPTVDGTGVRDYIHVVDLSEGHVAALNKLKPGVPYLQFRYRQRNFSFRISKGI